MFFLFLFCGYPVGWIDTSAALLTRSCQPWLRRWRPHDQAEQATAVLSLQTVDVEKPGKEVFSSGTHLSPAASCLRGR